MGKTAEERGEPSNLYVKMHKREGMLIAAVCDKELIGKTYEEWKLCLDLKKHAEFYRGELCTREQAAEKLKKANSMNLTGERAVALGIELGLVKKTMKIGGIPHAQAYLLPL